jgi:hypothetical protein
METTANRIEQGEPEQPLGEPEINPPPDMQRKVSPNPATEGQIDRTSTRTTGNDPVDGADPRGTRSTKPSNRDKSRPRQKEPTTTQSVVSGDRNTWAESRSPRKPDLPSS